MRGGVRYRIPFRRRHVRDSIILYRHSLTSGGGGGRVYRCIRVKQRRVVIIVLKDIRTILIHIYCWDRDAPRSIGPTTFNPEDFLLGITVYRDLDTHWCVILRIIIINFVTLDSPNIVFRFRCRRGRRNIKHDALTFDIQDRGYLGRNRSRSRRNVVPDAFALA